MIRDFIHAGSPPNVVVRQPCIIAEAGVNHEGSMDIARRLIDEAQIGGADAIKFQTYRAETLASRVSPSYWDRTQEPTASQYELFKKHDSFWKSEFEQLARYCGDVGIEFLSTPFDIESATFLNDMMNVYKISSSDITNRPFIEFMGAFGKPIILSTGASNIDEITDALNWISPTGNDVVLLHCVLNYPTDDTNANLGMITSLRSAFPGHTIGYSDHTLPKDMTTLVLATLLGATIIEKHFSHDKTLPGNDHYHAMDHADLRVFREQIDRLMGLVGESEKRSLPSEEPSRLNARRSLVAARDIPRSKTIERTDLTWKRPATGISPKNIADVVGKVAARDISEDETLTREMLQQ